MQEMTRPWKTMRVEVLHAKGKSSKSLPRLGFEPASMRTRQGAVYLYSYARSTESNIILLIYTCGSHWPPGRHGCNFQGTYISQKTIGR